MNFEILVLFCYFSIFPKFSQTKKWDNFNDGKLRQLVNIVSNPNCSQLMNNANAKKEIYIHEKHPIITDIINSKTVIQHYDELFPQLEDNVFILYNYINIISRKIDEFSLRALLQSLSIKTMTASLGLCINKDFYHSKITIRSDTIENHICNTDDLSKSGYETVPIKNAKNYTIFNDLYLEPAFCLKDKDGRDQIFIRIIYSLYLKKNKRIRVLIEIPVSSFKLDQCDRNLHHCNIETTRCEYHKSADQAKFSIGNYYCRCKQHYFMGTGDDKNNGFPGKLIENKYWEYQKKSSQVHEYLNLNCLPCPDNCEKCGGVSAIRNNCNIKLKPNILRSLPLAIQSFCITLCVVTGIIVFYLRRTRVIKSSHWILLELFLLGAILMYSTIINLYFSPSEITCAIQPFLRECGFVLMYGVFYVKIYRVLCTFQSRKAQRVYVRDQDIFRFLGVLVVICIGHLLAWMANAFDHKTGANYTTFSYIKQSNNICRARYWEIISYLYEVFLLVLTIYSCKLVKSAPSEYGEVRFITIAAINEFIVSLLVIITRLSISDTVQAHYLYLIHFIHCHTTATISVVLLFGPKLWYLYRPPASMSSSSSTRPRLLIPHTDSHIIQTQHKLNGDVDLVDINLADMDPENIRDELKRLYTQLEVYKTRAMRKDNPHVSRKRGGRKQRRFSLQHFHRKHHTASSTTTSTNPGGPGLTTAIMSATSVHEDEPSKISEDSIGPSSGAPTIQGGGNISGEETPPRGITSANTIVMSGATSTTTTNTSSSLGPV